MARPNRRHTEAAPRDAQSLGALLGKMPLGMISEGQSVLFEEKAASTAALDGRQADPGIEAARANAVDPLTGALNSASRLAQMAEKAKAVRAEREAAEVAKPLTPGANAATGATAPAAPATATSDPATRAWATTSVGRLYPAKPWPPEIMSAVDRIADNGEKITLYMKNSAEVVDDKKAISLYAGKASSEPAENKAAIAAMLEMAKAKQWASLNVAGNRGFVTQLVTAALTGGYYKAADLKAEDKVLKMLVRDVAVQLGFDPDEASTAQQNAPSAREPTVAVSRTAPGSAPQPAAPASPKNIPAAPPTALATTSQPRSPAARLMQSQEDEDEQFSNTQQSMG